MIINECYDYRLKNSHWNVSHKSVFHCWCELWTHKKHTESPRSSGNFEEKKKYHFMNKKRQNRRNVFSCVALEADTNRQWRCPCLLPHDNRPNKATTSSHLMSRLHDHMRHQRIAMWRHSPAFLIIDFILLTSIDNDKHSQTHTHASEQREIWFFFFRSVLKRGCWLARCGARNWGQEWGSGFI